MSRLRTRFQSARPAKRLRPQARWRLLLSPERAGGSTRRTPAGSLAGQGPGAGCCGGLREGATPSGVGGGEARGALAAQEAREKKGRRLELGERLQHLAPSLLPNQTKGGCRKKAQKTPAAPRRAWHRYT